MTNLSQWVITGATLVAAQSTVVVEPISPLWLVVLIAVSAVPAFLILHLVITALLMGKPYEFPIKIAGRGPKFCPHCGKTIAPRDVG